MPDHQTVAGRLGPRASGSPILLTLLFCVLAVIGGLAAAFGSVLIVGLLAAALVGAALLLNPRVHLFFGMVFALVLTGVMEFFFFFGQANWLSSLIVGSMLIPAILKAVWDCDQPSGPTLFGVLIVSYLSVLAFSSALNNVPLPQVIVGVRNYLPYIGVAMLVVYAKFDSIFVRRLPWFLLAIGLIQAPVALFQFFVVGPWRSSLRNAVGRSDEAIVGTFGGSAVTGGYTGEMASFLVMLIVLVLAMRRDRVIGTFFALALCVVLLTPILFAETKVSLVLLPVLILVCFFRDARRSPGFVTALLAAGVMLVAAVGITYFYRYWQNSSVATQQLGYSFDPNFMVSPTHRGRVGAVVHWYQSNIGSGDLLHSFVGHGAASTLEGSLTIGLGSAVRQFGLGLDSHAMSRLLWDGGILALVIFMAIGLRAFWIALSLSYSEKIVGVERSILTFAAGASLAMIMMLPYQVSVLGGSAMQFLFWFTIGLIELLRRNTISQNK